MKQLKRILAILVSILIVGAFVSSVTCTYIYHLNFKALWWSWGLSIFVVDVVFGLYIFYNTKRPDETKAFWLLVIIILPIIGCCLFLIFGFKEKCKFNESDNNHARLLHAIFSAKKSIKVYSNTFYPSYDTFNALNFASYKDVKVDILLSSQIKKSKQEYLEYKLEQLLDKKVNLAFTDLCVEQSFIIINDKKVIISPNNFNFKHIYSFNELKLDNNVDPYKAIWDRTTLRSSQFDYKNAKFSRSKRLKFVIINIFYSFL